ncbi:MAG: glycosyltransferase family A protein [Bacteroidota bacterium]|nr:glycosyltransferase family A protein [Bacteroidota bacterium]
MSVKVSICIPTFNQIEFLKKCLESIVIQIFTDFEIVISDDSTNTEVEKLVVAFFKNKNIKHTYHHNSPSLGSPANWNKAISLASGKYIKIMHHDDWFSKEDSLLKFVNTLENNDNSDFAFCSSNIFDVKNETYSLNSPDSDFLNTLKNDPLTLFNSNKIGAPSATIFRNINKLVFDNKMSYLVDVDFYIQCLKQNPRFIFINEPLIINTSNNSNQVTASSINKKIQIGEYCYLYNKWFNGKIPTKKYRVFFKDLFAWYNLNSFNEIESMGYEKPRPHWIFRLLTLQAKLKRND